MSTSNCNHHHAPARRQRVGTEALAAAFEIQQYLAMYPTSADTAEHIANWWLLRRRAEVAVARTQEALDYLEALGVVECSPSGVYRLNVGAND